MWLRDNKVWYEGDLIEKIKAECEDKLTQKFDVTGVTERILSSFDLEEINK